MQKVLLVATNHSVYPDGKKPTGLWFSEAAHFYEVFEGAGWHVDFVSPKGGIIPIDPRSITKGSLDKRARAYYENSDFMQKLNNSLVAGSIDPFKYRAVYFSGGHGTMWDFPRNAAFQAIARSVYENHGVVSAVCHGVCGLLDVTFADKGSLIDGKRVTGFSNLEEKLAGSSKEVPFLLEDELKIRKAHYSSASIPFRPHVVIDGMLVTGQNPASARKTAEAVLNLLTLPQS